MLIVNHFATLKRLRNDFVKISVITINRNNCEGLRRTIDSVVCQSFQPYDFIVIDGASSDGSAVLLDEYAQYITFSIREPDNGIYHAMNKGVSAARGEYCIFMNSGDVFHSKDVLERFNVFAPVEDIICGNAFIMSTYPFVKRAPEEITFRFLYKNALCDQAVIIKTELLKKFPYDESLKIVADRKFFFEALVRNNAYYRPVDVAVVDYDAGGYSARNRFFSQQEWENVLSKELPVRILEDYGREVFGPLYSSTAYERFFLELGRRNYRRPVYSNVRALILILSVVIPSARFSRVFPSESDQVI